MQNKRYKLEPGLEVTIYRHDISAPEGTLPVWTLVTEGLAALRQRDVALTIVRHGAARDAFPQGVLDYVPALKHFASQGRIVGDGDISGYRAPGPFNLGSFVGVAFMDATQIPGIQLPDHALAGVFITEGELAIARLTTRRVLNYLGRASRYFPTPYWSDPDRQAVYTVEDAGKTLLAKLPCASIPSATATLRGSVMHLSVPDAFTKTLAARTESREVSAVVTGREPGVSAALVWTPGQTGPEAIYSDGTEPTGFAAAFVAFIPNDAPQDDIRFMEDGYVVMLSKESAERLVIAMRAAAPLDLHGLGGERTLRITVGRSN